MQHFKKHLLSAFPLDNRFIIRDYVVTALYYSEVYYWFGFHSWSAEIAVFPTAREGSGRCGSYLFSPAGGRSAEEHTNTLWWIMPAYVRTDSYLDAATA